ncbi:MAG: 50S ribosomal protein L11 methyltransferase [Arenimonas sp.]
MHTFDGYSIKDYGEMVTDPARTQAFVTALTNAVTPESVVLEIGTGAGFFALLAIKLGAKKVYAVEPDNAIEVGKLCVKNNPGSERIVWLQNISTAIELPEKVDIVIGDLHGTMPFYNFNILSMRDAVQRHMKPGGIIMPRRDVLYAAPIQSPEDYKSIDKPWARDVHGLDLSAGRSFLVNTWWRRPVTDVVTMLAAPKCWGEIDYANVSSPNLDGECDWQITGDGFVHGFSVWFDGDIGPGAAYSNAPNLPGLVYGNAFFPLEHPLEVKAGERLLTKFSIKLIGDEYVYSWISEHFDSADNSLARFKQSTFNSKPISQRKLRFASHDFMPELNQDGLISLQILQAAQKKTKMGDIAKQLLTGFPERFGNTQEAQDAALKILQKYQAG